MTAWLALAGWLVAGPAMGLAPAAPGEAVEPASPGDETSPPEAGAPAGEAPPPSPAKAAPEPSQPSPPEGGAPGDAAEGEPAEAGPAPLPAESPAPPGPSEPRARGGAYHTPLPRPPEDADPSALASGPWRGRAWLGIGLLASFPVGGRLPAAGNVISAVGEITVGWRLRPFLALHSSLSTFAHDAAQQTLVAPDGTEVAEIEFGRVTAFDLVTARFFVPLPRRVEPWGEVGAGVGVRRGPFAARREAVGLVRVGIGVDFWLAPTFTLGVSTAYRTMLIGDAVGHGLRAGADLGIHW